MADKWDSGNRLPVEHFLGLYPDLSDDDAVVLIIGEALLRWQWGESPTAEEYIRRFPAYAADLTNQFQLEAELRAQSVTPNSASVSVSPVDQETVPFSESPPDNSAVSPPGFEILSLLGRGGMGVVYHARQTKLNRQVALKMILSGGHASEEEKSRFLAEAKSIAALNHPGIVQVYEFGSHDGIPYFALEYCAGGNLAKRLTGTPMPVREAATLIQRLAHAVHSAHEKGIVHRDLKPANVLMTKGATGKDGANLETNLSTAFSEISAVKISDFGLAKRIENGSDLTKSGVIMGTPSYMAPEQAKGGGKRIGPAADVYALGAIFYELLTGRPPFKEATEIDTLLRVIDDDPVSVRQLQKKVPLDLETICHKCLHKAPDRRYASAKELARDLGRWLGGEPIYARPAGQVEKIVKWAKRRPALASLLTTIFVATAMLISGALWYSAQLAEKQSVVDVARNDLDAERGKIRDLRDEAVRNLAWSNYLLARSYWQAGNVVSARDYLWRVPEKLRQWEWRYSQREFEGSYATLRGHTLPVSSVAFSPDGGRLATGSLDSTVKLWDARTGQEQLTLHGHTDPVWSVAFSPDGAQLATGGSDRLVRLWDARTGTEQLILRGHADLVTSVAFAPEEARLATASYDKTVKLWNVRTGQEQMSLRGHAESVTSVEFSPDGARLATSSDDNTVRIWDARTGKEQLILRGRSFTSVAFSPDGSQLATSSSDSSVKLWNAWTGQERQTLRGHNEGVMMVVFSPDGLQLATSSLNGPVKLWDARTGQEQLTLHGHTDRVWSVTFSRDGTRLVTGSWDMTAKLWDARTGQEQLTLRGHSNEVTTLAFSTDGARLATGSEDKTVKLWDARTGQEQLTLRGHANQVTSVALSPDGAWLATGSADCTVKLWDIRTGQEQLTLRGHANQVTSVAFSPDGSQLATSSLHSPVKLWDARTGIERLTMHGNSNDVTSLAFSPDGARLATGCDDGYVKVWDARTGQEQLTVRGYAGKISSVAFSPDGARLAAGSELTAKLWDARTGTEQLTLRGHSDSVLSVAFSPDGARLVTGSWDATAKLWDARTGQELLTLHGHASAVLSAAFSPDGRLATGSHDKTVKLWATRTDTEQLTLRGHTSWVSCVDFSPDGSRLATGSADSAVKLWDTRTGQEQLTLRGHTTRVSSVNFSPDGSRLATASDDNTVRIWDARTGHEQMTLHGHKEGVTIVAFSPDGLRLATASHDGSIKLWDAQTGQEQMTLCGHTSRVTSVAFAPNGTQLASRDRSDKTVVWDITTGRLVNDAPTLHWNWRSDAMSKSFSIDGKQFVETTRTGTMFLIRAAPLDAYELGLRECMARADPVWQAEAGGRSLETGDWWSARWHFSECLKHQPENIDARLGRARCQIELNNWKGFLDDARIALETKEKTDSIDYLDDLWLALGDVDRFRAIRKSEWDKLAPPGGLPRAFASLFAISFPFECFTLATAVRELAREIDSAICRQAISCDPVDVRVMDEFATSSATRAVIAIRRGEAIDCLGHVENPTAQDFLFQAIAELNRGDKTAARKQLKAAEAWLQAPSKESTAKSNRVALDNGTRLRVELLRREVRTKLGLDPNELLK